MGFCVMGFCAMGLETVMQASLGFQLEFPRDVLTHLEQGSDIPLEGNQMGHDVLSVVAFVGGGGR